MIFRLLNRIKQCNWRRIAGRAPELGVITFITVALVGSAVANAAGVKQEFPRLAGIQIGGSPYAGGTSNPEYRQLIAKLDLAILGSTSKTVIDDARAIKAINPNIKLGNYNNLAEILRDRQGYFQPLIEKMYAERGPNNSNAVDWWLRDANGNVVAHPNFPQQWRTNLTEYVIPDANGDRYPEFKARYDYDWGMRSPVWDIWYQDVVNYKPKFQNRGFIGDFSGGQVSDIDELSAAWRRGHRRHWDEIRRLAPDKMIVGNLNWYLYQEKTGRWDLQEFDNQIEGGVLERIMNWDRSVEAQKGWETLRLFYYWTMNYLRRPKLVIFNVLGDPQDYRFVRYAFTTCLMNDGYFDFSPTTGHIFGTVQWFDEFDLAGQSNTGWLGRAISPPPTIPWINGVYRRDFEYGVALVNPRGNGPAVVDLEPGLTRFAGNQDPLVNNGHPASTIKLADGDGIVLVRTSGQPPTTDVPPKPPALDTVE